MRKRRLSLNRQYINVSGSIKKSNISGISKLLTFRSRANLKYKPTTKDMIASAKFMLPGASDEIFVRIAASNPGFDPNKVHFVTDKGQEYKGTYNGSDGWMLTLVGGAANDGQHLYVVQETAQGKSETLARLNIFTYEPKRIKLRLVPVNGFTNGFTAQEAGRQLNAIYNKVGIDCEVEMASKFNYTFPNNTFNVTGSGLFSTLTDDMKALNAAYLLENPDEDALCLFIIEQVSGNEGIVGDMPRGKQFGYLFGGATTQTIAHEIAHGLFHLDHPFERANAAKSFDRGDLADNLMEYGSGTNLVKLQWDAIHAPGLVIGVFERDEDVMALNLKWVKDKIKEILKNASINTGHALLATIIYGIYIENFIDWDFSKWSSSDILDAMKAIGVYYADHNIFSLLKEIKRITSKHSIDSNVAHLMTITDAACADNIPTQDIETATALTDKMITADKDAATVIFGLLFEFKYGIGPETREFGENTVMTKGVKDFYLVEEGREYFYKYRANLYFQSLKEQNAQLLHHNPISMENNKDDVFYPTFNPVTGPFQAGWDLVKQSVGGFYMEFYPDMQGKQVELVLYNAVNLKSLVAHYLYINEVTSKHIFPETYPRKQGVITPLGETLQIIRWKDGINNERFNKYKP
jgi:hypothetical protein